MNEKNVKEAENSATSLNTNKIDHLLHDMIEQNKKIKKFYCLYKNGTKYIVKKKEREKERTNINGSKYNKSININKLENIVHNKFISKYKTMPKYYNSYIAFKLIHNVSSHIVASFKDYLIYGDIFDFLTKYYKKRKSLYLLKEILHYYRANTIIYPNYVVFPEGIYIFKNIQQKQRILDNKYENSKTKKKEKNEEDKILTSKVIDSILNQTDTSEARNCFGLDNNSTPDDDDSQEINLLIETINKIENSNDNNRIFQKKKYIRITNNNNDDLKKLNFNKLSQFINRRNNNRNLNYENWIKENINANKNKNNEEPKRSMVGELKSTISRYEDIKKQFNSITNQREIRKKYYIGKFNSINLNNNSNLLNKKNALNYNDNCAYSHKKMNTLEVNDIKSRKKIRFMESKEKNNGSFLDLNSPYVAKRPVKQSTSYKKKNLYSNSLNNKDNLIKNNNNFYIDNNKNIYQKKINKVNTLNILNTDTNIDNNIILSINNEANRTENRIKKYINHKYMNSNGIMNILTTTNEEPKVYNKIQNNYLKIEKLNKQLTIPTYRTLSANNNNANKMRKKIGYLSNHNFKSIAKMIKRKYIIDEDENNYNNTNVLHNQNKSINSPLLNKANTNIIRQKYYENYLLEDDIRCSNNKEQKNYFISNNITNNNYYTIDNDYRKNINFIINGYSDKRERNKDRMNKILVINNQKLDIAPFPIYNTLGFNNLNNSPMNSSRNHEKYDSNTTIKKDIISPYKNRLINKTSLKSLDKYSIQNLLNKFNDTNDPKYQTKKINKLSVNINNSESNYNQYNTINVQNNARTENTNRTKKRYLILHNYKKINIKNLKKNINNKLIEEESNDINHNNNFKTINSTNVARLKIPNLSTKYNNRNKI